MRRRFAILALLGALVACQEPGSRITPPDPDLAQAEPEVAGAVKRARERVLQNVEQADPWGRLGQVLHAHDLFEPAAFCYDEASRLAGGHYRWLYLAGLALQTVDPAESLNRFSTASGLAPPTAPTRIRRGDILLELGRPDDAAEAYREALTLDTGNPHALLGSARIEAQKGNLDAAIDQLSQAVSSEPRFHQAHVLLAQLWARSGDEPKAQAARARSLAYPEPFDMQDPDLAEMRKLSVSSQIRSRRGLALARIGQYREAERLFRLVLQARPATARDYANLGAVVGRQGRMDEAFTIFNQGLELVDSEPFLLNNMALLSLERKEPGIALALARRAVEASPADGETRHTLGLALEAVGDNGGAIEAFREAIRLNPGQLNARNNLGRLFAGSGKLSAAVGEWELVLDLDPENLEGIFNLGNAYRMTAEHPRANLMFERGLELAPNSSLFTRSLAMQLASAPLIELRDGTRAVSLCRRILAQRPNDYQTLEVLAAGLAEIGDFEGALSTAQSAVRAARASGVQAGAQQIGRALSNYRKGLPLRQP